MLCHITFKARGDISVVGGHRIFGAALVGGSLAEMASVAAEAVTLTSQAVLLHLTIVSQNQESKSYTKRVVVFHIYWTPIFLLGTNFHIVTNRTTTARFYFWARTGC